MLYSLLVELVSCSRKTSISSHPATSTAVTAGGLRELVAGQEILFARKFTHETTILGAAGHGTTGGGTMNKGTVFGTVLGNLICERDVRGRGSGRPQI